MQVSIEEVVSIFKRNIERDNLRNTPSRITILKAAYSHKGHFNAETIYNAIKDDAQSVSLATVYNTLELLQQWFSAHAQVRQPTYRVRSNLRLCTT